MRFIITYLACAFVIYGLVCYLSEPERITDIPGKINIKNALCLFFSILAVTLSVMYARVYLIFWLLLECFGILWWMERQKRVHVDNVRRGVFGILCMIVMNLSIIYLYYQKDIDCLRENGSTNYQVHIACYLGMALIEYVLIILREIKRATTGYKRKLMMLLAVKSVLDIVWLFFCIWVHAFKNYSILISLFFIAEILIEYISFAILILKIAEKSQQEKRADIHMNEYEYYLNMEEEHLKIRKMYHDMKNKLMIMGDKGVNSSEMKELEEINKFYHTGQRSLDILLFDGRVKTQAKNIEFDAVISEGCLDFMDEKDINIIFSNAIINAIEACEKIKQGPRCITIKAGKNLNDTLIYVKNTVSPDRDKGSLSTKKNNKIMHGIGLTSIQECAEKYGGYVSIIDDDSMFQLAILFGKEQ